MKRPIKIFYAIQVSNFTNRTGSPKWLLRNDACTNIAVGIISTILEKYSKNFQFIVKLPFPSECEDIEDLYELFDSKYHKNIKFYYEDIDLLPSSTGRNNHRHQCTHP